jgi:hypothetical protein
MDRDIPVSAAELALIVAELREHNTLYGHAVEHWNATISSDESTVYVTLAPRMHPDWGITLRDGQRLEPEWQASLWFKYEIPPTSEERERDAVFAAFRDWWDAHQTAAAESEES